MTDGTASRVAIIGIGNPMMGDDGIGPWLVSQLEGSGLKADLIDVGTGGMELVHMLARYDAVIIIDAVDMDLSPGESRVFSPDEVVSLRETRGYSLHDWDLMRSIAISAELGEAPERILLFAVQPGSVSMGEVLSPALEKRIPTYIQGIRSSLETLTR